MLPKPMTSNNKNHGARVYTFICKSAVCRIVFAQQGRCLAAGWWFSTLPPNSDIPAEAKTIWQKFTCCE